MMEVPTSGAWNSKIIPSPITRCCFSLLVRRSPYCTEVCIPPREPWIPCLDRACAGVLKQKELSEFIVSVIKGSADLTPKKAVVLDTQPKPSQDSETPRGIPVVHEEL